jgi:CIC family chloride channel protein
VFLAASVVVGVVVGLAAAALIEGLELAGRGVAWLGDRLPAARLAYVITIPAGFLAAWWLARRLAPSVAGDGVPEARVALALDAGHIPARIAPLKALATVLTVGTGGSAGREGPIVQIGAGIGSTFARAAGLGEDRVRSLVAAGAGAAIGASFNAPIAGMLFAMEVILGNFAVRHLNAVVVASVAAAVTTRSIVGGDLILRAFPFRLGDLRHLVLYALLGVLAAAVGWLFLRLVDLLGHRSLGGADWLRPVLYGLGVAGVALATPDVAGTGQGYVGGLLGLLGPESIVWYSLAGLALAKVVATATTLGAGGSGGAFMPSLFIGAALGAAFADLATAVWPGDLQPGAFAVVGMAATFAAVARAPLTSILIVFELTQDYGLVLPLMLATALATFLADRMHPLSVYTMALARRGITLARRTEVDLLDSVTVGETVERGPVVADAAMPVAAAERLMTDRRLHGLPVVEAGRLVGVVTVTDLARAEALGPNPSVRQVMTARPATATPSTPVSAVLERMAALGVGRIPIVADDDPGELVGVFRREDVVRAYSLALGQAIDHDTGRERLRSRTADGTEFHQLVVPSGSVADGRLLRDIPMPAGTTVVAVRRGTAVLVPDGGTRLVGGDVLTVFARDRGHERLFERIQAGDTAEMDVFVGESAARFGDAVVPAGSVADGRAIRDLEIPEGCTIVSVQRGTEVIVPDGSTVLRSGDRLTVFAVPGARRALVQRLQAAAPGNR